MARRMSASHAIPTSVFTLEETLPDIGAKATMAPTPIQRRACPGLAYPYSPMLPSVLAIVNVEGAHNRTTNTIVQLMGRLGQDKPAFGWELEPL